MQNDMIMMHQRCNALELCSLATEGTQELHEILEQREIGEIRNNICAQLIFVKFVKFVVEKHNHHLI